MSRPRPIRTPLRQRLGELRAGPLAALVWVTGAAACGWLLTQRSASFELVGLAHVAEVPVTSPADGEVAELLVELYDAVEAGEPVARLDDAAVAAALATADAEIERLRAELEAAATRLTDTAAGAASARVADLRRFRNDVEEWRLEELTVAVDLERDTLERARLAARHERLQELALEGRHPDLEVDDLARRVSTLDGTIARHGALLAEARGGRAAAAARLAEFEASLPAVPAPDGYLRPLREAVAVQALRVQELAVAREQLLVRAPIAGRVRALPAGPGQGVRLGDPIVVVTDPTATRILAYLPEGAPAAAPGERLLVARASDPRVTAETVVEHVGPAVEELPQRLWTDPTYPEYGLPVLAFAAPGLALVPGEAVRVRFTGERGPARGPSTLAAR